MARPLRHFEGFYGQTSLVFLLRRHLAGVRRTGDVFPNCLLTGRPGTGKSRLAKAIGASLGVTVSKFVAASDVRAGDLRDVVGDLEHGDVLFVDEAHLLSQACQDLLLGAVGEERKVQGAHERGASRRTSVRTTMSIASATLVCATDQPGRLNKALLSRLVLRLELAPYEAHEMREIVRGVAREQQVPLTSQAVTLLARASRGIPREARHLVLLVKTFFEELSTPLTKGQVGEFLSAHLFDAQLLRPAERRYLTALRDAGTAMQLRHVATILGLDARYVVREVEPELFRRGLVEFQSSGRRALTATGRALAEPGRRTEADHA